MPALGSQHAKRQLQSVWDLFEQVGGWPTVGQVANRLNRQHDLTLHAALPDVSAALLQGLVRLGGREATSHRTNPRELRRKAPRMMTSVWQSPQSGCPPMQRSREHPLASLGIELSFRRRLDPTCIDSGSWPRW